jgi:phosphate transport system substrate-binding protein
MHRLALPLLVALIAVACRPAPVAADPLAGDYVAATAESAVPIADRLTAAFAAKHPGMKWTTQDVGSSVAIELIKGGEADAGFLSRAITVEDERQVQAIGLGYTAQVLIVHPSNPVTNLSQEQLRGIFSGAIKDWTEVGGTAGPILVIFRDESSPTRTALDPVLRAPGAAFRADAISTPDADAMLNAVSASARAIGMVSALHLTTRQNPPRAIAIAGIAPTKVNVANGTYPYRRPITLIFRANTSLIRPGAKAFQDFVHGEDGQKILRDLF